MRPDLFHQTSYSCLTVRISSLLSWVQLGLLGSLPLHAWMLYCTELIRSAEYQLPGGLETGSQRLLPSPDKMHSLNGVFRPVGVLHPLLTLCLARSRERPCSSLFSCFVYLPLCVRAYTCVCVCPRAYTCARVCVCVHTLCVHTICLRSLSTFDISVLKCYAHVSQGLHSLHQGP